MHQCLLFLFSFESLPLSHLNHTFLSNTLALIKFYFKAYCITCTLHKHYMYTLNSCNCFGKRIVELANQKLVLKNCKCTLLCITWKPKSMSMSKLNPSGFRILAKGKFVNTSFEFYQTASSLGSLGGHATACNNFSLRLIKFKTYLLSQRSRVIWSIDKLTKFYSSFCFTLWPSSSCLVKLKGLDYEGTI